MLQRQIAMPEAPSPRVVSALREWLHGPSRIPNDSSSRLDDSDREMFTIAADLVALRPPPDQDFLSRLLRDHWPFPAEVIRYVPFLSTRPLLTIVCSVYHHTRPTGFDISKTSVFRGS